MSAVSEPIEDVAFSQPRKQGFGRAVTTFLRRKPLGAIGAAAVLLLTLTALLAPAISPEDPLLFHTSDTFRKPDSTYVLGTDEKGRDILSRVIYGARISLQVGVIAAGLGVTFGLMAGLVSGYVGGKTDFLFQRVVDSFQAFPALFLALAVTTALGRTVLNVGISLAIVTWPSAARVIRSSVLSHRSAAYVEAAEVVGAGTLRIVFRHILPNVMSIYVVLATAGIAQAILVEASLSF